MEVRCRLPGPLPTMRQVGCSQGPVQAAYTGGVQTAGVRPAATYVTGGVQSGGMAQQPAYRLGAVHTAYAGGIQPAGFH